MSPSSFASRSAVAARGDAAGGAGPEVSLPDGELVGETLDGWLRILRPIGRGGMGTVYVAEQIPPERQASPGKQVAGGQPVAVKVLNVRYSGAGGREPTREDRIVARLRAEARNAKAIRSEHVVDVFDIGMTEAGQLYVVMELLQGESLADRLRRCTALSELDTLRIGRQLATALAAAHRTGIVHRDIKPENVFLCRRDGGDFVKVLDFGISKVVRPAAEGDGADGAVRETGGDVAAWLRTSDDLGAGLPSPEVMGRLTRTGAILGSPLYLSPEQARGEPLDHRCDIYALGVVLYECLTGSVPFLAASYFGVIAKILTETPEPPSRRNPDRGLSAALEQIVLCAMAADPDMRYPTMDTLLADLERYERGEPIRAHATTATAARYRTGQTGDLDLPAGARSLGEMGRTPVVDGTPRRDVLPAVLPVAVGAAVVLLLGGLLAYWRGPLPTLGRGETPAAQTVAGGRSGPAQPTPTLKSPTADGSGQGGTSPDGERVQTPAQGPVPGETAPDAAMEPAGGGGSMAGDGRARERLYSRTASRMSQRAPGHRSGAPALTDSASGTEPDKNAVRLPPPAPAASATPMAPMPPSDEQAPNPFVPSVPVAGPKPP